jgi:two-component system sensor histidine kinase VicK
MTERTDPVPATGRPAEHDHAHGAEGSRPAVHDVLRRTPSRLLDGAEHDEFDPFAVERTDASDRPGRWLGFEVSFRGRLTIALIAAAILPLTAFGLVVLTTSSIGGPGIDDTFAPLLLFAIVVSALLAILVAYLLVADLTAPLRAIAAAVDRVSSGDLSTPIVVPGEDELARLAESHNRLADDLDRRNRELGRILAATEGASPRFGVEWLVGTAAADAKSAFGLIDSAVYLVDPREIPTEEDIPGEARPVRAKLGVGGDTFGVLVGHLPATRRWERADQDLLELFASEVGVAVRNAQLFERVEAQNQQLLELDAAKDDFLRGVSHNLQTPLARIRAYSEQIAGEQTVRDRRLSIISEQTDRLSRMVRQLLTVTRLESGALKPQREVLSLASRVRRTWEALGLSDVRFTIDDRSAGWLAVADPDQLDQVLWALLDNGTKYGGHSPIDVLIDVGGGASRLRLTITDHGTGIPDTDRGRLFQRFARGGSERVDEGSGLGLYVSRELCRAMDGDLLLEPAAPDRGASFTVVLPGEPPEVDDGAFENSEVDEYKTV